MPITLASPGSPTHSQDSNAVKTAFRDYLRVGHVPEALGMLRSGSVLSADAAKPIFTELLDGMLNKNDIPAAIKLLDAAIKDQLFGLLQLKSSYIEQSKQKVVDWVRSVVEEGFMTEDIAKRELGDEVPLCIKDRLKTVFLDGISDFVKKGWIPEAKESMGIALRYLGVPSEEIKKAIDDAKDSLKSNAWSLKDADDLLAFLAAINKGSVPEPKDTATSQPRLIT